MKKFIAAAAAVIMIISLTLCSVGAGAVGATTGDVDVIFLVDSSRSMLKSDPDMIRLEAIKLFADLCSLGSTKVGFVLFGSEINYAQSPTPIETEADRESLKNTVSGFTEVHGSTDIGKAVKYAVELLAGDGYNGRGKFIVFLSDGKTVINGNSEGRTKADSAADVEDAIVQAQEAGIPIYTIGLNSNGDVDEEELNHISSATYADETYMTDSAGDLSEILSDIYVRHTGAAHIQVAQFVSDGDYHEVVFPVETSTVVEANVAIMHSAPLEDIILFDNTGSIVPIDGTKASLSEGDNYSLVKIYYPAPGNHRISVKSPENTGITVNCILTMDYFLDLSVLTDKAVGADTKLKFTAVLQDPARQPISDSSILDRLSAKVTVTNTDTGAESDMLLKNEDGIFKGEFTLPADGSYHAQASLYSENISIRSEIIVLSAGSERFKEPEGPLKMILICVGSGGALILIIVLIAKKVGENVKMWSGRLTVSGNTGGMPTPPAIFDFAKKVPGKRKISLFDVLKGSFGETRADSLIPRKISESVTITMSRTGNIRISQVKDISYSGGTVTGKNTVIGSGSRATLKYADKSAGSNNVVIIQYMRT